MFRGRLRKLYQYESVHIHDTSSLYTRSAVFTQKKHKGELCIPQKPIGNQVPCVELCEYESARVRKCKDRSKMLKFINTNISHCSVAMRLEILVLTADTSFLRYTAANWMQIWRENLMTHMKYNLACSCTVVNQQVERICIIRTSMLSFYKAKAYGMYAGKCILETKGCHSE